MTLTLHMVRFLLIGVMLLTAFTREQSVDRELTLILEMLGLIYLDIPARTR